MKDAKVTSYIIGGSFVVLGLLLLGSLINWINSISIYQTTLPIVLIIGGFSLFSASNEKNRRTGLGLGMLTFGIISLLVRFNVLSGKAVNAVLGVVLLATGTIVLTKIADKHAVKNND